MSKHSFGNKVVDFYSSLQMDEKLPAGIGVMNPYRDAPTMKCVQAFYTKYFSDAGKRVFVFGINPGRLGAGATGVAFTDPVALRELCGIDNAMGDKRELSSRFVYDMIAAWGGMEAFYHKFYITSLSPLGFIKDDKNYNYYDDKKLQQAVEPFVVRTIRQQLELGAIRSSAICLGTGKNFSYFEKLNAKHDFFDAIIPLEHPRYIMQYKLRTMDEYVSKYVRVLRESALALG